ncbi:MAG: hypothetical protein KC427_02910 [Sulfurovum sp.]|uniref:hypothetical protein n=1 Tax=Sulfurovum sp. TaxID=1969726 RepID=UPI00286834D1|nr:hypothetical protein [Sulfurovum sp.]MCO4844948.1 hypothetical protein [Sulfurovum sp.]
MVDKDENYAFPWGFHIGDLLKGHDTIPLYTVSSDGGFCLLYDKASEAKADKLLESLCLELLSTMPHESLKVDLFDFGKKKFYNLSPLQYIHLYKTAYTSEMMLALFEELEETVISRHEELLCCNRPTISEHNQKSKLKKMYHLVLMNLENFPTEEFDLRRIQNFVESASQAGVYIIAFGNQEIEQSESKTTQAILEHLKKIRVTQGEFAITEEIFEFVELLKDHRFESLDLDKGNVMQQVLTNADLESLLDPENIKLEENTKVK